MKLHFLLSSLVASCLLISAPVSMAHGGGSSAGGGSNFHGGSWHAGSFHGHGGHYFHGHFYAPGFAFYGYGYPWWWDYPYYPYSYYGYDGYDSGPYDGDHDPRFFSPRGVQAALAVRGYYSGRIDGVIGPETRAAIRSFQAHEGLPVTGQIDSGLIGALRR